MEHSSGGGIGVKRRNKTIGGILAAAGVMVILSLVLPTSFWWFVLGIFLICVGISVMRRC